MTFMSYSKLKNRRPTFLSYHWAVIEALSVTFGKATSFCGRQFPENYEPQAAYTQKLGERLARSWGWIWTTVSIMLYWIVIQINLNSFNELFTEYQLCVVRPVARWRGYIKLSHPCSPNSIKNPVIMSSICPLNLSSKLWARIVQLKRKKNKNKKEGKCRQ